MTNLYTQLSDYKDKRVLITGVHGFKGSWMAAMLIELGAEVHGYGLLGSRDTSASREETSLSEASAIFDILEQSKLLASVEIGDVADYAKLKLTIDRVNPDIIVHMAAQPLVSLGYEDPMLTYHSNVMGTVAILEAVRNRASNKKIAVISVTTDKVYENLEQEKGYVESDSLRGHDPYSNSKSCADLATYSYNESYFKATLNSASPVILSTVRAGNVVGGGDFSDNRIIPDLMRADREGASIEVRSPDSVRPYQHVLDAVAAYALLAIRSYSDFSLAGEYNIGPNEETILTTSAIVEHFGRVEMELAEKVFHETSRLLLDSSKFREAFNWGPQWATADEILDETFSWYDTYYWEQIDSSESVAEYTEDQIRRFLNVER